LCGSLRLEPWVVAYPAILARRAASRTSSFCIIGVALTLVLWRVDCAQYLQSSCEVTGQRAVRGERGERERGRRLVRGEQRAVRIEAGERGRPLRAGTRAPPPPRLRRHHGESALHGPSGQPRASRPRCLERRVAAWALL